MTAPSSARLLRAHLQGEPRAADRLAEHAWTIAFRAANLILRDPDAARDVAQDIAIETLRSAERIKDPEALDAWIARATTHAAVRSAKRRRDRRDHEWPLDEMHDDVTPTVHHDGLDDRATQIALNDALRTAMASLSKRQREVLVLHYVLDMSYGQIAAALGMNVGNVGVAISRARAALRARPELRDLLEEGGDR